jgi:pyruvate/2-oxoglutarate dehydrogenase complex dihydrolipoamide dehydrogenase (E3) component
MASDSYDVLILGGGNAGFGVTVPTRKAGMTVAMVEERDLGGTCPNRGCTPKRFWWRQATPCTKSSRPTSTISV